MAIAPTLPLTSVEEYLHSSYHPDREYLDGALLERNVGERKHSRMQALLLQYLMANEAEHSILAYPEQRINVHGTHWRVPDVCVMPADHKREDVFTQPPLIVIEVLSREDEMGQVLDKCEDYRVMGTQNIAVADPYRQRVFLVDQSGRLLESSSLTIPFALADKPPLHVPFADLFQRLD